LKVHFTPPNVRGPGLAYTPVRALSPWKVAWATARGAVSASITEAASRSAARAMGFFVDVIEMPPRRDRAAVHGYEGSRPVIVARR
jgi:hypothetical protein